MALVARDSVTVDGRPIPGYTDAMSTRGRYCWALAIIAGWPGCLLCLADVLDWLWYNGLWPGSPF